MTASLQIIPVTGLPEIRPGDDLAALIVRHLRQQNITIEAGDVFVLAQKIVSKAEHRVVNLRDIQPSPHAQAWAEEWGRDARIVELVLCESKTILRMERGIIVSETRHGFICANAGVDASNTDDDTAVLLPLDPDGSAAAICAALGRALDTPIGVIISDTFGRAWREGLSNVALGVAGIPALIDYRGQTDAKGKILTATIIACADELAAAAELVMGKAERVPVVLIRGFRPNAPAGTGRDLIRPKERDLFR